MGWERCKPRYPGVTHVPRTPPQRENFPPTDPFFGTLGPETLGPAKPKFRARAYQCRMRFGQKKYLGKNAMATHGGPSVLAESTSLFAMS